MSDENPQTIAERLAVGFVAFLATGIVLVLFFFIVAFRGFKHFPLHELRNFHLWAPATCIFAFFLGMLFGRNTFGSFRLKDRETYGSDTLFCILVLCSAILFWLYFN